MNTKRMTCRAYIKSVNETDRTVEQIVSVFGNVDYGNDRVVLGAFKNSLERWAASGDPIPAIWSHTWDDPFAHIGAVIEARELVPGDPLLPAEIRDLGGLFTKYRVDDKPFAGQVFDLLKERRVREASFAYDVLKERRAPDGANDLLELDLIEVGPTLKGMNPMTQLLSMKNVREALTAELGAGWNVAGKTEEEVDAAVKRALEKAGVMPHTFIPGDDDRCTVCGLTRNTVGHLNLLEREAEGEKAWVNVAGSIEEIQEQVYEAAFEWARSSGTSATAGSTPATSRPPSQRDARAGRDPHRGLGRPDRGGRVLRGPLRRQRCRRRPRRGRRSHARGDPGRGRRQGPAQGPEQHRPCRWVITASDQVGYRRRRHPRRVEDQGPGPSDGQGRGQGRGRDGR
jgi:HK97 family phage prohead protease